MALGASPAQILGSMLRGAGRLSAAGIAVGAALTFGAERLLHSLMFGVGSIDLVSVAGAAGLMGAVSLAAASVPARRAAAIDPMESTRE
jgi:ABC-type antimicrobial peptide transport system permease subunit